MVVATNRVLGYARGLTLITYALIVFFASAAVMTSVSIAPASASTPTPSTWNLLAAGERTAIFPADVMQQRNITLNNGSYFYNLSNWSSDYNRGSFGFSPNSTVTLDMADTRDGLFSTWGLCAEDNSGALRMSWNRTGASGENVTAGYRIGCSFNVAGIRAVYQSNSQPTYYPSGPQRNVGNSALIAGGWTQCHISDYQQTVAYSTITNACTEPYILLAGYVGSSSGPTVSTFSSSTTTPRNDSNASYNLVFSQSVTGLAAEDFENARTDSGCTFAVSGSGTTYTLTISNCSDGTIQPRLKANSVTGSAFDGPTSAATATTTITIDRVAPTATATTVTVTAGSTGVIAVGSTGPGGGRVFYESSAGFACGSSLTETCHLLEAAPTSGTSLWIEVTAAWGQAFSTSVSPNSAAIGAGYKNTLTMIALGNYSDRADARAQAYRGPNNLTDWYLPSKDELHAMIQQKANLGPMTGGYWSSTQSIDNTEAWYQDDSGSQYSYNKRNALKVRPIRAFARSHVVVRSSETGTAYLVNQSLTVTNVASITGAADNLQNSVSISSANTDTNLSTAGLTSGTYKLYTVDAAGNLSAASTNTITIKPAAPGTPDLDAASDLGTSNTDNNTADDTPTFTVSSLETGAVVTLTATPASGSPVTCSFTATSASGSCTFTAMPNGTYTLTAVQIGSGISSDTSTALSNVVINKTTITAGTPDLADASDSGLNDSVNPFEAFGVSNSDDITNDNTPTINVSGSSSGTRTVTAAKAGSSVSCTLSSGAYTCGTAQSPLADGIWSITVTDTDSSGNSATSAALSVTIDTVPPAEFGGTERDTVPPGTNIQIQVPEAGSAQLRNTATYTTVKSALIPIAQANTSYTVQVPALNGTVIQIGQCYYLYAYDVAGNQRQSRYLVVCTASAAAPTIGNKHAPSGTYKFGQTLTNQMTVTGVPTPTVTYQYLRCTDSSNLNTCQDISGATSSTYTLTADDLGFKLGIRVTATNSQGSDTHTATSGNTITADSPGAPTSVSATITGETTASVSFTAPTFNGGSAITDYDLEYSSNNGSNWTSFNNGTSTANPILVTGLTKNTSYIFRVKAKNTAGDGSFSTASSPQTTFEAPAVATNEAPSGTRTVGQTMTNLLTFSGVPTPTVSYQWVRCSSVSGSNWESTCVDIPNATATSYTLTDADFNHHMGVRATAVNSAGTNVRMAVRSGAVTAVAPGVPTSVSATITGATTATVSFTAPTSTGGAAITGYTVTSTPTGAVCTVGANSTTYNCTGLTANTPYTFKVKATNTVGTGTDSVASSSQTTEAVNGPISANVSVASRSLTASLPISTLVPITASGGAGPRTYSITPSLPAGLSLNSSTGAITGTPSGASASTTYTVSVRDGSSTSSATFTLGVNAALASTAGTVPSGVYKDVAVTAFTPISFSGGTSPISYAVSPSLPAGLTLNTSTGVISGTATGTAANTTYTVTATDANGDTEASTFAFAVTNAPTAPGAPTIGAATSTGQTTATVAFTAPANTGGAAITTYTVTASPGGITATGSSSPITVTGLTAGTAYTFSITATNAGGLTSTSSSPSSSITTESAPAPSSGGGGGGGSPAPEPAPEPVCNAACAAAQNAAAERAAAEKAAVEKAAAEKVAAEKLTADKAAAVAVAEKTKVDVSAAATAATAAVEKATAAAAAKVDVDTVAAAVSTIVNSTNSSAAITNKITNEAAASISSAPAAATKAASTASANTKANSAASQVRAAATAAQKAATSSQAQTSAAPEISLGSSNTGSAAAQAAARANAAARAGKAAANEVAATAEAKAVESKATATALQNEANAAVAEAIAEQKVATALAVEAKAAADKASTLSAEKIAAATAAKTAAEILVELLKEKVTVAEKIAAAVTVETLAEAQKSLDTVNAKIAEAERTVAETASKADAAISAQVEAVRVAEAAKASAEAQLAKVDQLNAVVPVKAAAAVRAASVAAVDTKIATAAKAEAARVPSRAVISSRPGVSTGKNSTRATISGLKPGQKVKVTVNVKPKP